MRQPETDLLSEITEQLKFEKLLVDISTRFVNQPGDRIDGAIKDAQRRICEYLALDRSSLWQYSNREPGKALLTHVHQPPENPLPSESVDARAAFPWVLEQVLRKEIVAFCNLMDLPPEADCDRESFERWSVRSGIVVPLCNSGRVAGALSFTRLREEEDWPTSVVERFQQVGQVFANLLVRKHVEESLQDRLGFESLLAAISSRFINLPAEKVDSAIEDAQRQICEYVGVDLSALWQWSVVNPKFFTITHLYSPPEGPSRPEQINADEAFPWLFAQIQRGATVGISTEDLPPEAARDRETLRQYHLKSTLAIPLATGGGKLIGALSFDTFRAARTWPDALVKQLQLVAQIFTNTLARKHAELKLRESEARLRMATNAANTGLWVLDLDTDYVWTTPKTRELFRFVPEEELTYESFFKTIHPEDRERFDQAVKQAIQSGENLQSEFRIVLPDGGIRWIATSGKQYLGSVGESNRLMGVSMDVTRRMMQFEEIQRLKLKLQQENIYLRDEIMLQRRHEEIVCRSTAMKKVLTSVEQVAGTDSTVILQGETGTGKELLARTIHNLSKRKDRPLITINCAVLTPTLIESELFGREKGAYTGAMTRMAGRFEVADHSTLFLDEIAELSPDLQVKILRVLEEGQFERLGSTKSLQVDVRIIAATNRDLVQEVAAGKFRSDLYYRLNVFPIAIPPLRERPEDVPPLIWTFVKQYEKKMDRRIDHIPRRDMEVMQRYRWPGNAREVRNIVEKAMITSCGGTLRLLPPSQNLDEPPAGRNLEAVERRHILSVLLETGWRVAGKGGAAEILGINRSTLQSKMKKLGIKRPIP